MPWHFSGRAGGILAHTGILSVCAYLPFLPIIWSKKMRGRTFLTHVAALTVSVGPVISYRAFCSMLAADRVAAQKNNR
jgi:hypothetical protein